MTPAMPEPCLDLRLTFAEILVMCREARGLSVGELAGAAGIGEGRIGDLERARLLSWLQIRDVAPPTPEEARRLASALQLDRWDTAELIQAAGHAAGRPWRSWW